MQLNGNSYTGRHNRPSVLSRVGIEIYFLNNGAYQDPYELSSVSIYTEANRNSVMGEDNLLGSSLNPLMHFSNSATLTTDSAFDISNYTPGTNASGIFRISEGRYIAILDGTVALSGGGGNFTSSANPEFKANQVSAVGEYIDVWTVKHTSQSTYNLVFQNFELYNDTFMSFTEPLIVRTHNYLSPNKAKLGSKIDLKVRTDITVENGNIDKNMVNLFNDSVIYNPSFEIIKINEHPELPNHVTVSSFADTSSAIITTSENTLIFNWDTETVKTHAQTLAGNMGSLTGAYMIRVKYTLLNETIISPAMYFILS